MKKYLALILALACMLGLAGCAGQAKDEEKWDTVPMVRIDGTLYLDTGHLSDIDGRCGVMDGEITSAVDGSEIPTEDDQSNFGAGYGYQYGAAEGTVEVCMEGGVWKIFATEEVRQAMQFPETAGGNS